VRLAPLLLAGTAPAWAQQSPLGLDEIIVTAQKREESLQDVPISVQALGTVKLEQLNVTDFDDYANLLPSVSFVTIRPGYAQVYMRGVASAGDADANHSGSLPLIGTYLDEQPITTIQGALDVHLYDIARVEALAGPQGTLYGASSEAGTVKIVTNKPDPTGFAGGYGFEGNAVTGGENGYVAEGFVNVPLADNMAVRLVGWARHDAGYIDNIPFTRTFPSSVITSPPDGITTDNAAKVDDDYNGVDTYGARAALRIDLNENWTVTPSVMAQSQKADGSFGADNTLGKYNVGHGLPEGSKDEWLQAALTVEGRIGSWDMVYSGSYLDRDVDFDFDYADYSYWYDVAYLADGTYFSSYFYNDANEAIDFSQYVLSTDGYRKYSQELRFASPQDYRLRGLVGAFWQRQEHAIFQDYKINDLAESLSVAGNEDTIWLTEQDRTDEDFALFGEMYYDFTEKLTGTVGARWFKFDNSLEGYFGFGQGYSNSGNSGEARCDDLYGDGRDVGAPGADLPDYGGAPCKNLDASTDDSDSIWKFNLSYAITDDALVYATYSEGFRPGGINRRGTVPPYQPDFLNNYEVGWKTSWFGDRVRFNGAAFYQEWEDFQYSVLGPNGLTEVTNAPGDAEIEGLEMDVSWAVTDGFGLSAGVAFINAELAGPYCQNLFGGQAVSADPCPLDGGGFEDPAAPEGTTLPVTPDFKGNITGRYEFALGQLDAHVQAAVVYVGDRQTDLRTFENDIVGELPSYTLTNVAFGAGTEGWMIEMFITNAFDEYAEFSRYAQCPEARCGPQTYSIVAPPRTIGVKFSQEF
jgi:outer membrane receptor protein involved in Fe transport